MDDQRGTDESQYITANVTDRFISGIWCDWLVNNPDASEDDIWGELARLHNLRATARKREIRAFILDTDDAHEVMEWLGKVFDTVNHHAIDSMYDALPEN